MGKQSKKPTKPKADGTTSKNINAILQSLVKRAERHRPETLKETFVSIGGIEHALLSRDNKVIFGRRGTGKTHALHYVAEQKINQGSVAVLVDLRQLGSDVSIYSDDRIAPAERTARLLRDFIQTLHDGIIEFYARSPDKSELSNIGESLDFLAQSVSTIEVEGHIETTHTTSATQGDSQTSKRQLEIAPNKLSVSIQRNKEAASGSSASQSIKSQGVPKLKIRFGRIKEALSELLTALNRDLWICIDEWTAIPEPLQPYLADMLRRIAFPVPSIIVQIAAIEHRSSFFLKDGKGYIGIELGADAQANVNLDDFMVFENSPEKAKIFFSELIYRHFRAECKEGGITPPESVSEFIKLIFSSSKVTEEFVKAAEGVPRDAICILSTAAQRAGDGKITVPAIRAAARDWFQQDKSNFLRDNKEADFFLRWIIDEVIGQRKARAFLVQSALRSTLLDALFDHRLVHIVKRSVASHDEPGIRYAAYKLDYGCYVELIATKKAPKGLLPTSDNTDEYIEVPPDDYRVIRRAILDIQKFNLEKILESVQRDDLPKGPLSLAFQWDVSFAKILKFYNRSTLENDTSQLNLFPSEQNKREPSQHKPKD